MSAIPAASKKGSHSETELVRRFLRAIDQYEKNESAGPLMAKSLLADALECRATDIHIDPAGDYYRIRMRIDGAIINTAAVDVTEGRRLINQFRVLSNVSPTEVHQSESRWSGVVDDQDLDIRCTNVATVCGDKLCIRLLGHNQVDTSLDSLVTCSDQRQMLRRWLDARSGMLVIVGPTGSGKSTLLFSLAEELGTPDTSVVALEEPVERRSSTMTQIEVNSGGDDFDFADAVKVSLRLDPDFLVLGEMRGPESARAAVAATNSGRTLLTSMHGDDLTAAIDNLRSWRIDNREIASTLRCVVATRLIRRLCENCRTSGELDNKDADWLASYGIDGVSMALHPVGCSECLNTGFHGRVAIHRTWQITQQQARMIREDRDPTEIVPDNPRFSRAGMDLVKQGVTSIAELRAAGLPPN